MTILAAVGDELHSNNALSVGYDLATTHDDQLVVLHVIPTDEFNEHKAAVKNTPAYEHFTIDQQETTGAQIARQVIRESLDDFEPDRVEARGRVGAPAEKILDEADHEDARYLVVGRKPRTPVGKALFGSTTQSVLLNAARPVVTTPVEDH